MNIETLKLLLQSLPIGKLIHGGLEATGGLALLWTFGPKALVWLTGVGISCAKRAADALVLIAKRYPAAWAFVVAYRGNLVPLLRGFIDALTQVLNAFEKELEDDIPATPAPAAAAAPAPAPAPGVKA